MNFADYFPSRLGLLLGALSTLSIGSSLLADEPGISKTKPESGPFVAFEGGFMVPYTFSIEGTQATYEMIPVPGGKVLMGSPESEEGREDNEGPQVEIEIEPMWVSKTEITWVQYKPYMNMYNIFKGVKSSDVRAVKKSNRADAITVPTPLYQPSFTYEFVQDDSQPATTMTQYSAKQYTKWISGVSGQQYRLPSEAEWEYAARANSKTAYHFGDDASKLSEYAYFKENSPKGAGIVGTKLPNAFGLHDMHGNVWEWVVDGYEENGHQSLVGKTKVREAVAWTGKPDPRTVRGGGWQDEPEKLRSASRMGSNDEEWKGEDPNIPLSPWWFTSDPARSVGFRIFRSLKPLQGEEIKKYWEIDSEDIQFDVEARLEEGRGAIGLPSPTFAPELKKANQ